MSDFIHPLRASRSSPLSQGDKGGCPKGRGGLYMQLAVPKVVAIAVRMVITMLRTLPQVELLLNVSIVVKFEMELNLFIKALFLLQIYCTNFALCEIERDSER